MINIDENLLKKKRFEIGNIIKETRLSFNEKYSQEQMSEKIGLESRQAYANIENGITNIQLSHIIKFCEIFDCDVGYLFGEYKTKRSKTANIQKEIGLSESAITYLKDFYDEYKQSLKSMKTKSQSRKKAEQQYKEIEDTVKQSVDTNQNDTQTFFNNATDEMISNAIKEILSSDNIYKNKKNTDTDSKLTTAKKELDKIIQEENNARNKYLLTGMKLHTLNFILEYDKEYDLLNLIGRYLFGTPVFRNDITETAELYQEINTDITENNSVTQFLEKMPLDYLYQFDFKEGSILPILDFISTEDVQSALLVQLNNKLSDMRKEFRKENKENIDKALKRYLKNNCDLEDIEYSVNPINTL